MTDKPLGQLIDQLHDENIVMVEEKPIDYLGWFWRSIDHDVVSISYYSGRLWVNVPKKWGYPSVSVESDPIRDKIRELLGQALEDERPPSKKEFQRFLYEQVKDKELSEFKYYWDDNPEEVKYTVEWDDERPKLREI